MFESKTDVDRHVEFCLKKVQTESERNLRSFSFAKLYFNVGEFELARRYVSNYLIVKPKSAEAQYLLGKIYEKLGRREAALEAYRTSLDIDPKQHSLVLKVCELLASDDVTLDLTRARFWTEQAQQLDPQHPAVFNLKARLAAVNSTGPDDIRALFLAELEARPTDVGLRVRLLQHLLDNNQLNDAYRHAADIEKKNLPIFDNHVAWYETIATILIKYRNEKNNDPNALTWDFWMLIVGVFDKLVALFLDENLTNSKSLSECVKAVFNLDQILYIAVDKVSSCSDKQFVQEFLIHYRAQLCFHLAVLLLKQAKKEQLKYAEAVRLSLPLLLAAYHLSPAELQSVWLEHCEETQRRRVVFWHRAASHRCSQSGHVLLSFNRDRRQSFTDRAQQLIAHPWREKAVKNIFITRDQQLKTSSSYFLQCRELEEIATRLPDKQDLLRYDEVAQLVHPSSLHYAIWIGLNNDLVHFRTTVFDGLQFSVRNLSNCSAESLCLLDIQAFLYCCILCTQANIEESKHLIYYNAEKPAVLPAAITEPLGTLNQTKWYTNVYKMFKNEAGASMTDVRVTLLKGIEIVRCCGSHGLDAKLLVLLAETFSARAKMLHNKPVEAEALETRADLYWRTCLPLLEKLRNNQAISYPPKRWFQYRGKEMTPSEINLYIEEGRLFLAQQLIKKKENEKALEMLQTLKSPYASFYQAKVYKILADEQTNQNKENLTSEMRSQHIIMLSKARDCLYLTLDRLREPSVDRKHPLNTELGTEIEKIERMLSRIDPDICVNRNECDGMSDENVSSVESVGEHTGYGMMHSTYHNGTGGGVGGTTPRHDLHHSFLSRREARPSPERLDAQLRQLTLAKDSAVQHMLEQNRTVLEAHRSLLEEIRSFKDVVSSLTTSVSDLKDIKQSVVELKVSVDDLQNMKEQVYEIKKDLAELKKDTNKLKSSQINEEDLYALEEEYGVDYNINAASASGFNSAALYPNFPQRLQGAAANTLGYGAPGLYPSLYPMYPYGGLGLGQPQLAQAQLPFADGHVPDFRAMQPPAAPLAPAVPTFGKYDANLSLAAAAAPLLQPPVSAAAILPPIVPLNKAPPVNVVITASDPLPTTSAAQPVLSVTIPPQHLKGNQFPKAQPHNYQIPLPSTTQTFSNVPTSVTSAPMPVATQNLLSNVAPPVYSSLTVKSPNLASNVANKGLGLQIEKSLAQSFTPNTSLEVNKSNLNKSNTSEGSVLEEHDPCPDFKPIIPLPDEVPVTTGEEGEKVLFCEHAKLYRFVEKEWRERGVGYMKLLQNESTNKIRVLMRRDQVHKICANHFLEKDMQLNQMPKNERAYIWAANDFADESMNLEKFCIRFKTPEIAKKFYDAFEQAKKLLIPEKIDSQAEIKTQETTAVSTSLGGFVFTSTPTFKPKTDEKLATTVKPSTETTTKSSPFASFTFGTPLVSGTDFQPVQKLNIPCVPKDTSLVTPKPKFKQDTPSKPVVKQPENSETHEDEDFVPTTEFKPVIPLPDLVEVKTGEENYQTLYEVKAKLLRFDSTSKEWKERGVGIMKILKDNRTIRLLMRREQIHKVCCNHQLLKSMVFTNMPKNNRVLNWCAQDFSENIIKTEMFAIRFRTAELCEEFLQHIQKAQETLDGSNNVIRSKSSDNVSSTIEDVVNWGNRFKPADGSWECSACYVNNVDADKCVACGSYKEGKDSSQSPQKFNKPSPAPIGPSPKPKINTWECKVCFIHNDGKYNYCEACDSPKNDGVPVKNITEDLNASGPQFSFGNFGSPVTTVTTTTTPTSGWGDLFKPKIGAWECKACYILNEASALYCLACESPKDDTVPKKEAKGFDLSTGSEQKFSFGIPSQTESDKPLGSGFSFGVNKPLVPASTGFTFGVPKPQETNNSGFSFGSKPSEPLNLAAGKTTFSFTLSKQADQKKEEFVFGSPQKHEFEFKPRSPRKVSGSGDGEESDGAEPEEECDTYFKPVIPLPDKVEVRTGEEDERVLYCHRAKLFRFTNGEWKERGIGDVKILQHPQNNKLRILMRREQIHKICLNHALTKEIEYTAKDDHTWLFTAADYSDGEISYEQFCLRFKNAEIASNFIKAVNDARKGAKKETKTAKDETKSENDIDPDLEIIYELKVPLELQEKALKLQLPKNFYAYLQKEPCKGCIGCNDENFVFSSKTDRKSATPSSIFGKSNTSSLFETPKTIFSGSSTSLTTFDTPKSSVSSTPTFNFGTQALSSPFSSKTTASSIFTTPSVQSNVFEGGSMLFGQTTITPVKKDSTPAQPEHKSPLAPSKLGSALSSSNNIFSMSNTPPLAQLLTSNKPATIFGGGATIFGGTKSETNIFSGTPKTESNLFANASSTNLFGGKPFTSDKPSIFGNVNSSSTPSFGSLSRNKEPELVLKCDTDLSFAALASANQSFAATENQDSKSFAFAGAGSLVFGGQKSKTETPKTDNNTTAEEEEVNEETDDNYDPHYEPIVPLPDAIVVKTGEEDETIIFSERAKLYRYSAEGKEWKERGVGNIKLLFHPERTTYRLLMRREQVHKLVLNQLITPDLEMNPLQTSDRAWCWVGYNHSEDGSVLEQLAVRFKNPELATKFKESINQSQLELKNEPIIQEPAESAEEDVHDRLPNLEISGSIVNQVEPEPIIQEPSESAEEDVHEEEEDEYGSEDSDENSRTIMFIKRCTLSYKPDEGGDWQNLGMGTIKMLYDSEMYGARVEVADDAGHQLSNTIIAINTVMKKEENSCVWRAVEWSLESPSARVHRAVFSSAAAAQEMYYNYEEALQYAQHSGLFDTLPNETNEI